MNGIERGRNGESSRNAFGWVAVMGWLLGGIAIYGQSPPAKPFVQTVLNGAGQLVNPFASASTNVTVFIFVRPDCPISNRYVPELRKLTSQFRDKGVISWLVYADTDLALEAIQRHLKEFQLDLPFLRDPEHELVRLCRVHVTPEAAVFDRHSLLIYHGRIDDRFVGFGQSRPAPTRRDLEEVLSAVVTGKATPLKSTRAIGCTIEALP